MTDGEGLLAAIIAEPDDDVPRLIYADWLDEQGDATRAEFIRVQVELFRLPGAEQVGSTAPRVLKLRSRACR